MDDQKATKWSQYSRFGMDIASAATSVGFSAAKAGTKLGFSITRGIASTTIGLTGSVVDHALFGGSIGAGPLLGGAVGSAISAIESLALAPILLGESLTSTSLVAAQSSLPVLNTIFPGSDEASFSLLSFVQLVRREWKDSEDADSLPDKKPGLGEVMTALVGWATLQGVTSDWQEERWFKYMKEIHVNDEAAPREPQTNTNIHVTTDVIYPSHSGQIITADIGEAAASPFPTTPPPPSRLPGTNAHPSHPYASTVQLKHTLRRLSKLVLGGYGGASLLFFGVSPVPDVGATNSLSLNKEKDSEETKLANAVHASDANDASLRTEAEPVTRPSYSWWNVLLGRHDNDIFLQYANSQLLVSPAEVQEELSSGPVPSQPQPLSAVVGGERLMPRFWVLTDHARGEVVLVLRGTMSLNELAVDLTCEPTQFELPHVESGTRSRHRHTRKETAHSLEEPNIFDEELDSIPGSFPIDISKPPPRVKKHTSAAEIPLQQGIVDDERYEVHGGIFKMAMAMGGRGRPVYVAIQDALRRNRNYSLVLCGHSLGAGVAALLALMWADPATRLTHRASGLPSGRLVSAYCFAPPCVASANLARRAAVSGLVTSFVYSHDVVSRLSLGAVRDLKRAAAWLANAPSGESSSGVTARAVKWKMGMGKEDDVQWFVSIRKTLEANMQMAHLYPPGRVFWALRNSDLQPAHRHEGVAEQGRDTDAEADKVRLFEVLDAERVFGQMVFARDMLSSHLPHQYDVVLGELL